MSRNKVSKEFRCFAKKIEEAGGEIRHGRAAGSHPRVFYRGQFVTVLSLTPSDFRSRLNERARCRRAGMSIA